MRRRASAAAFARHDERRIVRVRNRNIFLGPVVVPRGADAAQHFELFLWGGGGVFVECGNATRNKCAERHGRGKARKVSAVGGWVSGFSGSKKTRCLPWFVTPRWEAVRVAEPWVLNGARTSAPQHGGSFEPRRREGDSMSRRTGLRTEGLQEARCVAERKFSSRWFWILASLHFGMFPFRASLGRTNRQDKQKRCPRAYKCRTFDKQLPTSNCV